MGLQDVCTGHEKVRGPASSAALAGWKERENFPSVYFDIWEGGAIVL